jgi:hypothetical protein
VRCGSAEHCGAIVHLISPFPSSFYIFSKPSMVSRLQDNIARDEHTEPDGCNKITRGSF